jgi:hypothetical protein
MFHVRSSQVIWFQKKDKNSNCCIASQAILITCHGVPWGCEMSGIPHFLDNRLKDECEFVSLTSRPRFAPGTFLVSFLLEGKLTAEP